jgi:hypothetical protein
MPLRPEAKRLPIELMKESFAKDVLSTLVVPPNLECAPSHFLPVNQKHAKIMPYLIKHENNSKINLMQ